MNLAIKFHLALVLALCWTSFDAVAEGANVMPAGFENVFLGMTTQQLHAARSRVEFDAKKNLGFDCLEIISNSTFFRGVDYSPTPSQTVEIVSFWPVVNNASGEKIKGFIKGCIAKYGLGYKRRFYMQSFGTGPQVPVSLLKWSFGETNVVASFVSQAARSAYLQTGGSDVSIPFRLEIYQTSAASHGILLRYVTNSLRAEQDATGQAFTNFPAFLDGYTGPVWE